MSFEWHDLKDAADPELDRLAERYHLHPLHIEDCRHRNQNAKVEELNGYIFVVLKPAVLKEDRELDVCDLDIFLGPDFFITVREGADDVVGPLLDRVRKDWGSARGDQIFYRIADGIVDSYLPVLDRYSDAIDSIEDLVLEDPDPNTLQWVFETKRSLIQLRRVIGNMRDVAAALQRAASPLIAPETWPFLRDLYDHLARDLDLIEVERDILNGALDIYLSSVANRTNRVMKVLTVLGTVALPILIVSSIYGMNVRGLPWSNHPQAFLIVSALSATLTVLLLLLLRLLKWF
jgi:magnesium transporter